MLITVRYKIQNQKPKEKNSEIKDRFIKRSTKLTCSARLTKRNRKDLIIKIKNQRQDTTINITQIKGITIRIL